MRKVFLGHVHRIARPAAKTAVCENCSASVRFVHAQRKRRKSLFAAWHSRFCGYALVGLMSAFMASSAFAESLSLQVEGIDEGSPIAPHYAYCAPEGKAGGNFRPALMINNVPSAAKSLAVVMVDPDVPTDFSDAGKKDKVIPAEMKRQDFYHWVAFNIPTHVTRLPAGKGSGKEKSALHYGVEWVNDYAAFHKGTPAVHFTGYDGPCPPFNDARLHHYHFQIHALDVPLLKPSPEASAKEVAALIRKHSIAEAVISGTYTLNKDVK
jgi:Raf kinase inhibitor-like YbhB/YbcL family protein